MEYESELISLKDMQNIMQGELVNIFRDQLRKQCRQLMKYDSEIIFINNKLNIYYKQLKRYPLT